MIVKAYIDKSTSLNERIQSTLCVVFVCPIWWSWLRQASSSNSSKSKTTSEQKHLKQQYLPKQALINIHLFNSQGCESFFRDARSLSGSFSTMVNFTIRNFIRRSQKLSILNQFKYEQSEHNHFLHPTQTL
ncbi:unnamed protein product, partial [Rotaria sp. Silwood2]